MRHVRFNLPLAASRFTGRDAELDAIHERLGVADRAVVTQAIIGLGGVGKASSACATSTSMLTNTTSRHGFVLKTWNRGSLRARCRAGPAAGATDARGARYERGAVAKFLR